MTYLHYFSVLIKADELCHHEQVLTLLKNPPFRNISRIYDRRLVPSPLFLLYFSLSFHLYFRSLELFDI